MVIATDRRGRRPCAAERATIRDGSRRTPPAASGRLRFTPLSLYLPPSPSPSLPHTGLPPFVRVGSPSRLFLSPLPLSLPLLPHTVIPPPSPPIVRVILVRGRFAKPLIVCRNEFVGARLPAEMIAVLGAEHNLHV